MVLFFCVMFVSINLFCRKHRFHFSAFCTWIILIHLARGLWVWTPILKECQRGVYVHEKLFITHLYYTKSWKYRQCSSKLLLIKHKKRQHRINTVRKFHTWKLQSQSTQDRSVTPTLQRHMKLLGCLSLAQLMSTAINASWKESRSNIFSYWPAIPSARMPRPARSPRLEG